MATEDRTAASPSREALRRIRELEAINAQQARELERLRQCEGWVTPLVCDKCGELPFWGFTREGDPCPCGGKLVLNV